MEKGALVAQSELWGWDNLRMTAGMQACGASSADAPYLMSCTEQQGSPQNVKIVFEQLSSEFSISVPD